MSTCCVKGCTSNFSKNKTDNLSAKITFYPIPSLKQKDKIFVKERGLKSRRYHWLRALNLTEKDLIRLKNLNSAQVCSLHFTNSDFINRHSDEEPKQLKRNAIPSMKLQGSDDFKANDTKEDLALDKPIKEKDESSYSMRKRKHKNVEVENDSKSPKIEFVSAGKTVSSEDKEVAISEKSAVRLSMMKTKKRNLQNKRKMLAQKRLQDNLIRKKELMAAQKKAKVAKEISAEIKDEPKVSIGVQTDLTNFTIETQRQANTLAEIILKIRKDLGFVVNTKDEKYKLSHYSLYFQSYNSDTVNDDDMIVVKPNSVLSNNRSLLSTVSLQMEYLDFIRKNVYGSVTKNKDKDEESLKMYEKVRELSVKDVGKRTEDNPNDKADSQKKTGNGEKAEYKNYTELIDLLGEDLDENLSETEAVNKSSDILEEVKNNQNTGKNNIIIEESDIDEAVKCEFCQKPFKSNIKLWDHINLYCKKAFRCEICKGDLPVREYKQHLEVCVPDTNTDTVYGNVDSDDSENEENAHVISNNIAWNGPIFKPKFLNAKKPEPKIEEKKDPSEKFMCTHCNRLFDTKLNCERHMLIEHKKRKKFFCRLCESKFDTGAARNSHVIICRLQNKLKLGETLNIIEKSILEREMSRQSKKAKKSKCEDVCLPVISDIKGGISDNQNTTLLRDELKSYLMESTDSSDANEIIFEEVDN